MSYKYICPTKMAFSPYMHITVSIEIQTLAISISNITKSMFTTYLFVFRITVSNQLWYEYVSTDNCAIVYHTLLHNQYEQRMFYKRIINKVASSLELSYIYVGLYFMRQTCIKCVLAVFFGKIFFS